MYKKTERESYLGTLLPKRKKKTLVLNFEMMVGMWGN